MLVSSAGTRRFQCWLQRWFEPAPPYPALHGVDPVNGQHQAVPGVVGYHGVVAAVLPQRVGAQVEFESKIRKRYCTEWFSCKGTHGVNNGGSLGASMSMLGADWGLLELLGAYCGVIGTHWSLLRAHRGPIGAYWGLLGSYCWHQGGNTAWIAGVHLHRPTKVLTISYLKSSPFPSASSFSNTCCRSTALEGR